MMTSRFLVLAVFLTAGFLAQPVLAEGVSHMRQMIAQKSPQPQTPKPQTMEEAKAAVKAAPENPIPAATQDMTQGRAPTAAAEAAASKTQETTAAAPDMPPTADAPASTAPLLMPVQTMAERRRLGLPPPVTDGTIPTVIPQPPTTGAAEPVLLAEEKQAGEQTAKETMAEKPASEAAIPAAAIPNAAPRQPSIEPSGPMAAMAVTNAPVQNFPGQNFPGQNASVPARPQAADDGIIRLAPDSTKVIHLDQDAASVVVANPQQASVLLDNPRLMVVMPKQPGSTSLTVLDSAGRTIMEKRILISGTQSKAKYVRVRRMCGSGDTNCAPSSYFYCPDGCYEVSPVAASDAMPEVPPVQGAPAGNMNNGGNSNAGGLSAGEQANMPQENTDQMPDMPPRKEPQ